MKTAPDIPEVGRTVEKTTVTRVLPLDPSTGERKSPEYWDYVQKLTPLDWERHPKHTLYLYRRTNNSGPMTPLERLSGSFLIAGRDPVSLSDPEEFEIAVAQKYGGGVYRLILKKGSERITEGRIEIDGPPKNTRPGILDAAEANPGATVAPSTDPSTDVAKTAMNIVANNEAQGLQLGMAALHSAADVVKRFSEAPSPSQESDITRMFMHAMIQRMTAPQPDPFDMFQKFAGLMATVGGGNGAVNPQFGKFLEIAVERALNPPPSGPVSSAGAELVRQLPQVASYVTDAIREWRVGSEAQLHTAQIMASARPALPPGPGTVQPPAPGAAPGRPITQATQITPPPTQEGNMPPGTPSLEFIESKIVEILKRPLSTDDAADEVLSFLDLMAPSMVDQLAGCNESQLMQLFQTRPVLRQYHDLARLQEFVRSFLKFANDNGPASGVDSTSKPN